MKKMNFREALAALANGIKDDKLFVACESFVAEISCWTVHMDEDGAAYVYAKVCCVNGTLPFIPDDGKSYDYGNWVQWYLDTDDVYFATKEDAAAYAAECIFAWVENDEGRFAK